LVPNFSTHPNQNDTILSIKIIHIYIYILKKENIKKKKKKERQIGVVRPPPKGQKKKRSFGLLGVAGPPPRVRGWLQLGGGLATSNQNLFFFFFGPFGVGRTTSLAWLWSHPRFVFFYFLLYIFLKKKKRKKKRCPKWCCFGLGVGVVVLGIFRISNGLGEGIMGIQTI
jgi:uncharacterized membrane protein SirB2